MEKADSNFVNVEELPEVESAMLNLKQTDVAYRELLAVMLEAFVAQARAGNLQVRLRFCSFEACWSLFLPGGRQYGAQPEADACSVCQVACKHA